MEKRRVVVKQKGKFLLLLILAPLFIFNPLIAQLSNIDKILNTIQEKQKKNEPIGIKDFPGFMAKIPMPKEIKNILDNISITLPKIDITPTGFIVSGSATVYKATVSIGITVLIKEGKMSFKIAMPTGWKFSDTFKKLKVFDKLRLKKVYFVISEYAYRDLDLQVVINPGLNIGSDIELTNAVKDLKEMVDKVLGKFLVAEQLSIKFFGYIPENVSKATCTIIVPARIGIDFEELHKKGKIKVKPFINRIYTADFIASVSTKLDLYISTGVFVEIPKQKPLEFRGGVAFDPKVSKIAFEGIMKGMIKPAFGLDWLSLGNLGMRAGFIPAFPFIAEAGISGAVNIGDILKDASALINIDITGGSFIIDTKAKALNLDNLIALLVQMAKKDFKVKAMPPVRFSNLRLKVVPADAWIFGERYRAGLSAGGAVQIDTFKGSIDIDIIEIEKRLMAKGRLFPLKVPRKKPIFIITGTGPDRRYGTSDDSVILEIDLGARLPIDKQKFYFDGTIEITPIKLKQKARIGFEKGKFSTAFETKIFNLFSAKSSVSFNTKHPEDFIFEAGMQQDFGNYVNREVGKAMAKFEENAKRNLGNARKKVETIDEKMDDLRRKRDAAFRKLETGVAKEVRKLQEKIAKIDREISYWKEQCKGVKKIAYPFKKCGRKILKLIVEKTGLKIGKGVMTAGKKIIAGVGKAVAAIDKALKLEEAAQKVARAGLKVAQGSVKAISEVTRAISGGFFAVENASIKALGKDLIKGNLPRVSMTISIPRIVTLNFRELQFDIKRPGKLFKDIARQIVDSVKKKKK